MEDKIRLPSITIFKNSSGNVEIDILWSDDTIKECADLLVNTLDGNYNNIIIANLAKDTKLATTVKEIVAKQHLLHHLNQPNSTKQSPIVSPMNLWNRLSGDNESEHDHDCDGFHDHDSDLDE